MSNLHVPLGGKKRFPIFIAAYLVTLMLLCFQHSPKAQPIL